MKKFMKSAVAVLLACLLLIPGGFVFAEEESGYTLFSDVDYDNDWFAPCVDYCTRNGLVNGMTATTFEPDTALSRAMFVTVLYRFEEAEPTEDAAMPFTDVAENHWAKNAILWAYENEIVNGMTPTTFAPDKEITREQMCTILCRFAEAMGYDMITDDNELDGLFVDSGDISDYAFYGVYVCAAAGIVNGMTETHFMPKESATRAQACAILQRFIRLTTTTVHEVSTVNGMTVYAYMDKYGVYAEEHFTVSANGDPVERVYSDGVYHERETWTYNENGDIAEYKYTEYEYDDSEAVEIREIYTYNENGDITERKCTYPGGYEELETWTYNENGDLAERRCIYTDGSEERDTYTYTYTDGRITERVCTDLQGNIERTEYNEFGNVSRITRTVDDETVSVDVLYVEGSDQIGAYAITDPDGVETVIWQYFAEDGSLEALAIKESDGAEESSYVFKYNEDGSLSYLKMKTPEFTIESVEGSFEEGLPTELTLIYDGETYDVNINWWAAHADVTLNGVPQTGSGDIVLMVVGMVAMIGDSYEVVTLDNVVDLLY